MSGEKRGVPSETIQQIRERVDIVDLISTYVSLAKAGQNFKGLCPFHSEKSPSFFSPMAPRYLYSSVAIKRVQKVEKSSSPISI